MSIFIPQSTNFDSKIDNAYKLNNDRAPLSPDGVLFTPYREEITDKSLNNARSIDDIPQKTKDLYNEITSGVKESIDTNLTPRERLLAFFDKTINEIMTAPIEVEIEPHEMREAILFSRLGVDFLKVKEANVRMDMLTLAKDAIDKADKLTQPDKQVFYDRIKDLKLQLEQQIADLMKGVEPEESDKQEALKFEKIDEVNPLLNQLQQSKNFKF
ncbi:hypothetical protein [Pseudoalteromonas denitrificans]|uniref:Uncharacterized protein n=1 Tax=Pseudoalteromonas denitrificans DSM 6059 TaxID=1123010 RepID=A0A1I1SJ45_9GAMM|nr:hypothetical protein [Pseudoalteromonas denitrificans]SFD46456.1 hypothetical protein SAMN02745724_04591 [Pseudoalteromonas denitrificans DSM 6059]